MPDVHEPTLKTDAEVADLEKLIVQLEGLHTEVSILAKKSPDGAINLFKLKIVNRVLTNGNAILRGRYQPLEEFEAFDEDALPTNSDAAVVLALYIEQAERFRSKNVVWNANKWRYVVNGEPSAIQSKAPSLIGADRK